eukprot:362534-Chlamydomonas_euryale.AAC.3
MCPGTGMVHGGGEVHVGGNERKGKTGETAPGPATASRRSTAVARLLIACLHDRRRGRPGRALGRLRARCDDNAVGVVLQRQQPGWCREERDWCELSPGDENEFPEVTHLARGRSQRRR